MKSRALRRLARAAPACAVVTGVVLARADAPPDQYANFDAADVVISDNFTFLNWQRHVTTLVDFPQAVSTCGSLSLGTYAAGWRLPSYKELLTLVDESPHTEYPLGAPVQIAIDGNAFPETPVAPATVTSNYWSSSVVPGGNVLGVEFNAGNGQSLPTSSLAWVRCVHD